MFQAQCPLCKGLYQAQPEWVGKQATCPHCHQIIVIQQTNSEQQPVLTPVYPTFNTNAQKTASGQQEPNSQATMQMACPPLQNYAMQLPETRIARVGTRFVALLLDGIFTGILGIIVGVALGIVMGIIFRNDPDFIKSYGTLIGYAVGTLVNWIYEAYFLSRHGATPGKMLFHLKVLHNGQYVSAGRAILRNIGRNISAIILFIGFIIAFFNKEHKAFHDMLCDTVVVEE